MQTEVYICKYFAFPVSMKKRGGYAKTSEFITTAASGSVQLCSSFRTLVANKLIASAVDS